MEMRCPMDREWIELHIKDECDSISITHPSPSPFSSTTFVLISPVSTRRRPPYYSTPWDKCQKNTIIKLLMAVKASECTIFLIFLSLFTPLSPSLSLWDHLNKDMAYNSKPWWVRNHHHQIRKKSGSHIILTNNKWHGADNDCRALPTPISVWSSCKNLLTVLLQQSLEADRTNP